MSRMPWKPPTTFLSLAVLIAAITYAPAPGDRADLAIIKSDSPDPVVVGSTLTYTIQVSNLGPHEATDVTVRDTLPGNVSFLSATSSSGTCTRKDKKVTCAIGNLAADATKTNAVTITIQVRPTKAGKIDNTATVDGVEKDPVGSNNKAKASTTVLAAPRASSCRGITTTLTGTGKADRLVGSGGPDVIAGLGGRDTIFGLAGRDLICSGSGNDRVGAGSAADRVFGGAGGDILRGRGGRDLLAGNPGDDTLAGNHGRDRLRGGRGSDLCLGGAGRDRERGCER
jgi:uncharacterized repeat protein (TIGR01451 family)